jgi:hypothetical protein
MPIQDKYFITSSNFKKLVQASHIKVNENLTDVYQKIYSTSDLSKILNHNEARSIRKSTLFLQESEKQLLELEKLNKINNSASKQTTSTKKFIFESGAPKYHTSSSCETLTRDFNNFTIPDEIRRRGESEIEAFIEFAKANRKLLGEGKEDIFLLRLQTQFKLESRIDKVSYPNSGKFDIPSQYENVNLSDITARIEVTIEILNSFTATEEGKNAVKKLIFAPLKRLYEDEIILSAIERSLLETKRDLINLILQYHTYKHKDGTVTFSASLLEFYGFKPCGVCCKENIEVGFNSITGARQ